MTRAITKNKNKNKNIFTTLLLVSINRKLFAWRMDFIFHLYETFFSPPRLTSQDQTRSHLWWQSKPQLLDTMAILQLMMCLYSLGSAHQVWTLYTIPSVVNPIDFSHIYMPMVTRVLIPTAPSFVNPIFLLHIYVPIVMRGLTLTVPSLVKPTDLLHIYMPLVMRVLTPTVPSFVSFPHWLTTHVCSYSNERVNPHSTKPC